MISAATVWWVKTNTLGKLGLVPRPRGGDWLDDDVVAWSKSSIDAVVSMLTQEEAIELELQQEQAACVRTGLDFYSVPTPDRGILELNDALNGLLNKLAQDLRAGKNIVVHCRQSIGRASLLVALVLVRMGIEPNVALANIQFARGYKIPDTTEQLDWFVGKASAWSKQRTAKTVGQKLQAARHASGTAVVQWEQCTRLVVTAIPRLDLTYGLYYATRGQEFAVSSPYGSVQSVPYDGIAEQDLPRVILGAVLWEVESLEDNSGGSRQHTWRWIFEEAA